MTGYSPSYPVDLIGDEADPPRPPTIREVTTARRARGAEAMELEGPDPGLRAAGPWRMAGSLMALLEEADACNPGRDRASDGGIGDLRHTKNWEGSDHNPWLSVDGRGVVRARDFDVDGLDVAGAFERIRVGVLDGRIPQMWGGGYLIVNRRITAPDFRGWLEYHGPNPHVLHGHVSVSLDPARFDDRRQWGVWTPPRPARPSPAPAPAPARPVPEAPRWTGPDLRGRGPALRGEFGANGPRVALLQEWLRRTFPLYAKGLAVDGVWGPATSAALAEYAHRSGIGEADGRNVGPKIARRLHLSGFRG